MNTGFTLADTWRFLRLSWRILLAFIVLGAIVAGLMYLLSPRIWSAQAELVLGGFGVPASLQIQGSPEGSGALGLDMPIESSVKIAMSAPVAAIASQDPRLRPEDQEGLAQEIWARAEDANGLVITGRGDSAKQAELRTLATTDAFVRYRTQVARSQLKAREDGLRATVSKELARASQVERALSSASANHAALTQEYGNLRRIMTEQSAQADEIAAFAARFSGGVTVVRPAYIIQGNPRADLIRFQLIGALVGALLGALISALWRRRGSGVSRMPDRVKREEDDRDVSPQVESPMYDHPR